MRLHLVLALLFVSLGAWAETVAHTAVSVGKLPSYQPRYGRTQPIIAVVAENTYTELTDYVVPYGVLVESGVAQVHALATRPGPVQLFPALKLQPQATVAEFDARHPQGADYVIVPAVHATDDPALLTWVKSQASKGATVVGVCDGVWVLANAGLLDGRKAVGHWFSMDDLRKKFPRTEFQNDLRYHADRKVVTTTGVTASIPVSLALVEAIAGRPAAQAVAQRIGAPQWNAAHRSSDFKLTWRLALTAAQNWLAFWSHDDITIDLDNNMDEIALALTADAWSRSYRSSAYSQVSSAKPSITSRRGLVFLPDRTSTNPPSGRRVTLSPTTPPSQALDKALGDIAKDYGAATAQFVALQLEYPQSGSQP